MKRKRNRRRTLFHLGTALFAALFLLSGFMLLRQYRDQRASAEAFHQLAALVRQDPEPEARDLPASETETAPDSIGSAEVSTAMTAYEKYADIYAQNTDFVGWLSIDGTGIDYPVMQSAEPDYYLKRAFDRSYSAHGTPYMQENCDPALSDNLIIYGHNMRDGSMFADLVAYADASFYRQHPIIHFDTLWGFGEYEIVAVFQTVAYSSEGFQYYRFVNAEGPEDFDAFLAQCQALALYDTGVDAQYGDKLITLSTCEYSRGDGRMVVVAKQKQSA